MSIRKLFHQASLLKHHGGGGSLASSKSKLVACRFMGQIPQIPSPKESNPDDSHVHFRVNGRPHPLNAKPERVGDHTGMQQNHIWTKEELDERMSTLYRHDPKTFSDRAVNKLMYGLYHTFNFVTGYDPIDPGVKAMEWRLIMLESIAGVPGFVAAGFRHFRSLRQLKRDYGWIPTLLEEAENERMHLLICLSTFQATPLTRWIVIGAQYVMVPFLMSLYLMNPKSLHRFVGYLEETACYTYVNVIKHIETPGTKLNAAWASLPAPDMAIGYYHLHPQAKWVDSLKCMMADEANHRDTNHTFANMQSDDPSPFVEEHHQNAAAAWRLNLTGEPAWTPDHAKSSAFATATAAAVQEKATKTAEEELVLKK